MNFYPKIKVVGLDIDEMSVKSKLTKLDRKYLDWISSNIPALKKTILAIVELSERILPVKYELIDPQLKETFYLHQAIKDADYVIIITDRSAFGINTIMKRLPAFEKIIKFSNHMQVRKSFLNIWKIDKKRISESEAIKPDPDVLRFLRTFAMEKMIKPEEILIADDNPHFRKIAKGFGFQIFPNDIITTQINQTKLGKIPYAPLLPS
jgi:hypothetical protein